MHPVPLSHQCYVSTASFTVSGEKEGHLWRAIHPILREMFVLRGLNLSQGDENNCTAEVPLFHSSRLSQSLIVSNNLL